MAALMLISYGIGYDYGTVPYEWPIVSHGYFDFVQDIVSCCKINEFSTYSSFVLRGGLRYQDVYCMPSIFDVCIVTPRQLDRSNESCENARKRTHCAFEKLLSLVQMRIVIVVNRQVVYCNDV